MCTVNFLGPDDEYVASGSDDGNFFLWHKSSGDLHGVYEGDGTVVNVIESHPRLPLVAVSGIDTTVKVSSRMRASITYETDQCSCSHLRTTRATSREWKTRKVSCGIMSIRRAVTEQDPTMEFLCDTYTG